MLEVRVLGGLAADVDGRPVRLPADARARELLGWLVVEPGRHARPSLAGRLRPDVGEESARKTLRDAVYELRGALDRRAVRRSWRRGTRSGSTRTACGPTCGSSGATWRRG